MPISVVFDPPLPSDSPSTFNTKAFTLLGDLNDWSTQANALPGEVATNLSALLASPPAIGSTTPAAGSFTTLSASGPTQFNDSAISNNGKGYYWYEPGTTTWVRAYSPSANVLSIGGQYGEVASLSSSGLSVTGALSVTKSGAGYQPAMLSFATPTETSAVYRIGMGGGNLIIGRTDTSTTNVTLDSSGNLGIGVTPSTSDYSGAATILNVKGNSSSKIGAVKVQSFGTANATGIELFAADGLNEAGLLIKGAATSMVFFTGSTPTKRATLDASGNLGIGATPSAWTSGKAIEVGSVGNSFVGFSSTENYVSSNTYFNSGVFKYAANGVATSYGQVNGEHRWKTAPSGTAGNPISFTQAMTLDANGSLLVGATTTSPEAGMVYVSSAASSSPRLQLGHALGTASGGAYLDIFYNSAVIGSITQSGTTAVLYNTTSDQRLKENVVDAPAASNLIDAIQVRSFDWKSDGSHQRYGMVAQELYEVAPEAVSKPADPDEMMAVDYSKLVPMLVKEIQSLRARVASLEAPNVLFR